MAQGLTPMKRFARVLTSTACFGLAGYCAWLAAATPPAPPESLAAIGSDVADLGVLGQGATAAARFDLVNNSPRPITVQGLLSSCGCTLPNVGRKQIPPAERTRVDVEYHSKAARGLVSEWIDVQYSDDGGKTLANLHLWLKANVVPDFDVAPASLEFWQGVAAVKQVRVMPNRFAALEVSSALCDRDWFLVAQAPGSRPHSTLLTIKFDPAKYDELAGQAKIAIRTNSPNEPTYYLQLAVERPASSTRPASTPGGGTAP